MFRGVQNINVDAKGRMAMPARYRDALNLDDSILIATIDIHSRCLRIYPLTTWEGIEKELQSLPNSNPAVRRVQRLVLGHASELESDANGRVRLPQVLREYAGLEKKVVLVGQGQKFELWAEDSWLAECEQAIADANSGDLMSDELSGLVF